MFKNGCVYYKMKTVNEYKNKGNNKRDYKEEIEEVLVMTHVEEENFIKEAYQVLIERGVITEDMLSPSTVTDEMLEEFEQEFDVKLDRKSVV